MRNTKCFVPGCDNTKQRNPDKYFLSCPSQIERRESWIKAVFKETSAPTTRFSVCEDHFDLGKDVETYKVDGRPLMKKTVSPNRNFTPLEIALQAKINKLKWSCFVPSCKNRGLSNRKVVFFPFPEGWQGQLWKLAVWEYDKSVKPSSVWELKFFCEEHFDTATDIEKHCHRDSSVEFTVKVGIIPSLNLSESKPVIGNKTKKLLSGVSHPRCILNNYIDYLCAYEFPAIIKKLRKVDDIPFVNTNDEKSEPVGMEVVTFLKIEPMYTKYECERFVIEEILDDNPLKLKSEIKSESESEKESYKEDSDDHLESSEDENDSVVDTAKRFECCYCKQFVRHLESHVQRVHLNFSKNVNSTICGLCFETFPCRKHLKNHQTRAHNGNAYACDSCDCMTKTYFEIYSHIFKVHSIEIERPFLCQHCGIDYKHKRDLNRHMGTKHTNVERQRSYSCRNCDKKFFTSRACKGHRDRVHLKLRPHHCKVNGCNKAFFRKWYLKTHEQKVHLKLNFHSCVICKKEFSVKGSLTVHMKNIHKMLEI